MSFKDGVFSVPAPAPDRAAAPNTRLDGALRQHYPAASWSSVRRLIETGKVQVNGALVTDSSRPVRPGDEIAIRMAAPRAGAGSRGPSLPPDVIVFADAHLVVANKPSGIMSVPYEDERDSFVDRVGKLLEKRSGRSLAPLGIVHRIDKETSGLLVFTRRASAKHHLEQQFRAHTVRRIYTALVHGTLRSQTFRSRIISNRGDGLRGSTTHPKLGQLAITHVRHLESLGPASLVECQLETGRTHQIRIHLAEAGHPLLGERVYVRGFTGAILPAPRMMLHARSLGFEHPATSRELDFTSDLPADMRSVLAELRAKVTGKS